MRLPSPTRPRPVPGPTCVEGTKILSTSKRGETKMKLSGKICVITGGASGIGLETARCFARAGGVKYAPKGYCR